MKARDRIPTEGGVPLAQNPFAKLNAVKSGVERPEVNTPSPASGAGGLPANSAAKTPSPAGALAPANLPPPARNRGRVDITRQTAGRGGKTVTVVSGFMGIGQAEKEQLVKKMQKACGAGGTVKDGCLEIQGDKREQVAKILTEAGFRPVFAGG